MSQDFVLDLHPFMFYIYWVPFGLQNFNIFICCKKYFYFKGSKFLETKHAVTLSYVSFLFRKVNFTHLCFPLVRTHGIKSIKQWPLGNINGQTFYRNTSEYLLCSLNYVKFQPELSHYVELVIYFRGCDNTPESWGRPSCIFFLKSDKVITRFSSKAKFY